MSEFVAALRQLASTCQFLSEDFDNQIHVRLMHCIQDNEMQIEVINVETEVTLKTAMDAAMCVEHSRCCVKKMSEVASRSSSASADSTCASSEVNFVKKKHFLCTKPCWRYTGRHSLPQCRY